MTRQDSQLAMISAWQDTQRKRASEHYRVVRRPNVGTLYPITLSGLLLAAGAGAGLVVMAQVCGWIS